MSDSIINPLHYAIYPIQPIGITRYLDFCMGNAVKYILRAPYKGGVEDCDKALRYIELAAQRRGQPLAVTAFNAVEMQITRLTDFLCESEGDELWEAVAGAQAEFLDCLQSWLFHGSDPESRLLEHMARAARSLRRVLSLRDTTGQIYEGMSGLPGKVA